MSKIITTYKLTIILGLLFLGAFVIDTVLRFHQGVSFTDYLLGTHADTGLYPVIWFKGSFVIDGELWRIITWPLLFISAIYFVLEFPLLMLLLSGLEQRLGSLHTLIRIIFVHMIYTGMLWLTRGLAYSTIDIGFVSIDLFLFGLIGIWFTEKLLHDGKISRDFGWKEWVISGYTAVSLILQLLQQSSGYAFLYALSIGILVNFLFNFKASSIMNTRLPVYQKKICYVTYGIIAISIIIFLLDILFVSDELKVMLYDDFSFSRWINYFLYHTGDKNGAISSWLCLNTEDLYQGQIWRMFTLVFSHYGFEHLLFNMPAIFLAGCYIESHYGSLKTLLLFEGSAFFVSCYACLSSLNGSFSGFGGTSLGIYALLTVFILTLFEQDSSSKPHRYELAYVILYFVVGNIPTIGVRGDNHLHSFLFGLMAYFILRAIRKKQAEIGYIQV